MPLKLFRRKPRGPYYVRGTVAGHRIYESTGHGSRRLAEAWAIRRENEILERDALGEKATLTFSEAVIRYLARGRDGRFLDPLLEHFGPEKRAFDIDNSALMEAANAICPGAAPATINRQIIAPAAAVINLAAKSLDTNARAFPRLPEPRGRTRWLSPHEFEAMLEAAAPHLVPILAAMIGTGARTSEILRAEVKDFHPATGEIWLPETKSGWPRMAQMPERARDLVLAAGVPAHGRLFRDQKGTPYAVQKNAGGVIKTAWRTARLGAGLGTDVTPHVLRHTWATWFYASTRDYGLMLDLGGWRTTSTAERYRKLAPADLGARVAKAGWDFTRLGDQLPDPAERRDGLRAV